MVWGHLELAKREGRTGRKAREGAGRNTEVRARQVEREGGEEDGLAGHCSAQQGPRSDP